MDYVDDYWGLYRDYYKDPFPHSLLSTRLFFYWLGAPNSRFLSKTVWV